MSDSQLKPAERQVQPWFMLLTGLCLIAMPLLLLLSLQLIRKMPDRHPVPERTAEVTYRALKLPNGAGAWIVEVDDHRFGGVSALALDSGRLLALTDRGLLAWLPKPGQGGKTLLRDLPGGPGPASFRRFRDSEALVRRPGGGWWVAFENRHSLWHYDESFTQVLGRRSLPSREWPLNSGVEAMAAAPGALMLVPERGAEVIRLDERRISVATLQGATGGIADAVSLPDGRVLVLVREVGAGLTNQVAQLKRDEEGYRLQPLLTLPLGRLSNAEAMAAEPLPTGATRLWIMTDNDFSSVRRTILIALDLPKSR